MPFRFAGPGQIHIGFIDDAIVYDSISEIRPVNGQGHFWNHCGSIDCGTGHFAILNQPHTINYSHPSTHADLSRGHYLLAIRLASYQIRVDDTTIPFGMSADDLLCKGISSGGSIPRPVLFVPPDSSALLVGTDVFHMPTRPAPQKVLTYLLAAAQRLHAQCQYH